MIWLIVKSSSTWRWECIDPGSPRPTPAWRGARWAPRARISRPRRSGTRFRIRWVEDGDNAWFHGRNPWFLPKSRSPRQSWCGLASCSPRTLAARKFPFAWSWKESKNPLFFAPLFWRKNYLTTSFNKLPFIKRIDIKKFAKVTLCLVNYRVWRKKWNDTSSAKVILCFINSVRKI